MCKSLKNLGFLLILLAVALACQPSCGQMLPASWRIRVAKSTPATIADGYLIASRKEMNATKALSGPYNHYLKLDNQPILLTSSNAAELERLFRAEVDYYSRVIEDRGYAELTQAFYLETDGNCKPFGFSNGPVLLEQVGFELTLWQNGLAHRGAVVESTVSFEHAKSVEIRFAGDVAGDSITLRVQALEFAESSQPTNCSLKLIPVEELTAEFGSAFLERAIALLDRDDYANASVDLDRAIELNPKLSEAFYLRSQLRSVSPDPRFRNGTLAIEDAKQACEMTDWTHWQCLAPLACAYAEAGDFDTAIETMKKAQAVAPREKQQLTTDAIEKFKQKKPLRYPLHTNMPSEPVAKPYWTSLPEKQGTDLKLVPEAKSGKMPLYRIQSSGLPPGSRFRIWMKGLQADWKELPDVGVVEADGRVAVIIDGTKVPMTFGLGGFHKGESTTFVFVSENRDYKVTLKVTPRPLSTFDAATGYGVEAELLEATGNFYLLTLKGFDQEQAVKIYLSQAAANKEVSLGELKLSDPNAGPPTMLIATAVYGKSGDLARVRIVGQKGELRLELPWGDHMPDPLSQK